MSEPQDGILITCEQVCCGCMEFFEPTRYELSVDGLAMNVVCDDAGDWWVSPQDCDE